MKKKFLLFTTILAIFSQIIAIVCQDNFYIHSHLNLYVCQDQPEFDYELHYKWKARSVLLNQYIDKMVKGKKLASKKVNFQVVGPMSKPGYFEVSQNKNGYYIFGFNLKFKELIQIIEYFTHPKWEPDVSLFPAEKWHSYRENFFTKINKMVKPDYSFFKNRKIVIKNKNGMNVTYMNEELYQNIDNDAM